MIQVSQIKILSGEDSDTKRRSQLAKVLHINPSNIGKIQIRKKSLDARKHPDIYWVYQLVCSVEHESEILKKCQKNQQVQFYEPKTPLEDMLTLKGKDPGRVIIVGCGPAGLFTAYCLSQAGIKSTIVERGKTVEQRMKDIEEFWDGGSLNPESNVSFGEGGAGTFSDGKLNTAVKDKTGRIPLVLRTFVKYGAPQEIEYLSKPHIGTDLLRNVILNMRKELEARGCTFLFETKLVDIRLDGGCVGSVIVEKNGQSSEIKCDQCVLAIGHSARDTFSMLVQNDIPMETKPFAIGVRAEHLQKEINTNQYGMDSDELPAADYKCTGKGVNDRGVYSFCMCPGGFVVNASSEQGALVVNGMSNHDRSERNANSAIIVTVTPEDFPDSSILGGVHLQQQLEKAAFEQGKGKIPVQLFGDFEKNVPSSSFGHVTPNTKGGTILANVREILPEEIGDSICMGMHQFAKRIHGFDREDTLMLGVETRTSSPVRILRGDYLESDIKGLYPCGEGAGYAGGIMSAAVDGVKVAQSLLDREDEEE